jgi:ribosome-associated toxin RatA of RatAB toxin-antitoxin module
MRAVKRTALVNYTPAQMFALVADFECYPQFLPWVVTAKLLSHSDDTQVGQLTMLRSGLRETITTRNTLNVPSHLRMELVEGPFKTLDGHWRFTPITDAAGTIKGTRVELDIQFEFKNSLLNMMLGKAFEASCGSLVESFTHRANLIYGGGLT